MSAAEIIEQIKALSANEKAAVVDFVKTMDDSGKEIHFATPEQAKKAGDEVVQQYESVFRKLAQ